MGVKYLQVFVNEASRNSRVLGLKTRDAAQETTVHHIHDIAEAAPSRALGEMEPENSGDR